MSELVIADVSEHQETVDWYKYVGAGNPAAIVRAHNGFRNDKYWPANRDVFWQAGGKLLGIYQFVESGDVDVQAEKFCDAVGTLRPGEFVICDLEKGSGDQSGRAQTWRQIVEQRLSTTAWLYSGQYFHRDQQLARAGYDPRRTWIAAYASRRPEWPPHAMWQFSESYGPMPGIRSRHDASYWYGTVEELAALVGSAGTGGGGCPPAKQPFPGAGAFVLGQSNPAVTQLGEWLIARGYGRFYRVGAGPVFTEADKAAVRQFQLDQGFVGSGADGYPGPQTWDRLQS